MRLSQHGVTLRAVAFGGGDWCRADPAAGPIDVAFRPVINAFKAVPASSCNWSTGGPATGVRS